jgi:hypothetical protein
MLLADVKNPLCHFVAFMCLAFVGYGCNLKGYSVVAMTGTVIGVDIAQNPATQTPHAKLGYNRGELALVPTNRYENPQSNSGGQNGQNQGAKDSANVLMELRYGGIFDLGASSGIYQRLAVGDIAVKQPGAAAMFLKNANGELDDKVVSAIKALPALQEQVEANKASMRVKFQDIYLKNKAAPELAKFETAAKSAGYEAAGHADYPAFRNFIGDLKTSSEKVRAIRQSLELQGIQF